MSANGLDGDCDCCAGVSGTLGTAGGSEDNPAGQAALRYRAGTHGSFLRSQLAALPSHPGLATLRTRASDDPAVALLDAWSAVLDVLSFYQERIANEGFLRTATERGSVLHLARAIGYELRPGVAASTFLAFGMETAAGAPASMRIAAGTRAQSIPGQDESAQTFETLEAIEARPEWNALAPLAEATALPGPGSTAIYLRGQSTRLQKGDSLLIVGPQRFSDPADGHWDLRHVTAVQTVLPPEASGDPLAGYTIVTLDQPLQGVAAADPAHPPRVFHLRAKANLFGANAPDWRAMPASLRGAYLGMDPPTVPGIGLYPDWPNFTLADVSDPPSGEASGTGLFAEYYLGIGFNTRAFWRTDATVNFNWAANTPDARLSADFFSVRWTGWLQAPAAGDLTLIVGADDGVRVWFDGNLVVDSWTFAAPEHVVNLHGLQAGRKYDLRIDYFEYQGAAAIKLEWQANGLARQVVPTARLYPRDIHTVHLDAAYPRWLAGGWAVLTVPGEQKLYQIDAAAEDARARFTLTSKTTRLVLHGTGLRETFNERLRQTTAYGESAELLWAARPLPGLLSGHLLELGEAAPGLDAGRWIAVSGKRIADTPANAAARQRMAASNELAAFELARDGIHASLTFADGQSLPARLEAVSEVVRIHRAELVDGRTRLELESDLQYAYLRPTARINANVANASHGDGKQMQVMPEVLGSGDRGRVFQRFMLRQAPLTWIAAGTPSGVASTLEIRVDGLLWHPSSQLTAMGPRERGYLLRLDDSGNTTVQFGDGVYGARLPTGQLNVEARYRVGIGAAGNVARGQISLLLMRPYGLKEVINPVAASGGADPEAAGLARRNAPLTVRTLDRIVSLRDFEDFGAAFAGIGKAQAVWLWNGEARLVHLTVSGLDGAPVDPLAKLYRSLAAAIDAVRPAHQPLVLAGGSNLWCGLQAKVRVLADYESATVLARVRAALSAAFGFEPRQYGQALSGSEILAVMQGVTGVDWVDLDALFVRSSQGGPVAMAVAGPDGRLHARRAHYEGTAVLAAELLLLDPADVQLTEIMT
ncbi:putative baseplate assembly protein [Oxalobacteraceae bacterium]|nr:putative baseplate assembly protein [Oxalobacteraceae bacterium]